MIQSRRFADSLLEKTKAAIRHLLDVTRCATAVEGDTGSMSISQLANELCAQRGTIRAALESSGRWLPGFATLFGTVQSRLFRATQELQAALRHLFYDAAPDTKPCDTTRPQKGANHAVR